MIHESLRPAPDESSSFYHYIAPGTQRRQPPDPRNPTRGRGHLLQHLTEASSLSRYEPDKWTVREALNHISDTERLFTFRAFWIARGLSGDLASFDQNIAATHAEAVQISLAAHLEELHRIRLATLSLFHNLPAAAWPRQGIVNGAPITVRALGYITAGHFAHHLSIFRERYA